MTSLLPEFMDDYLGLSMFWVMVCVNRGEKIMFSLPLSHSLFPSLDFFFLKLLKNYLKSCYFKGSFFLNIYIYVNANVVYDIYYI